MHRSSVLVLSILVMAFGVLLTFSMAETRGRRLIAVFDFDYSTIPNEWGEEPMNIGGGIADMLVTQLVGEGTYTVIERKKLQAVLDEQLSSHGTSFDQSMATEVGKILGVDAIVLGSVTQFGLEKSTTGNLDAAKQLYGGVGNLQTHVQKAVVGLDARIIDTRSGVVIAAATGLGIDKRAALTQDVRRDQGLAPGSHRSFSDISQSLVGAAASSAVSELALKLVKQADRVQSRKITGLVADVDGDIVTINIGRVDGVAVGDMVAIERLYKVVKDPSDPTKILRRLMKRVALAQVTEVDEKSALAVIVAREANEESLNGQDASVVDEQPVNQPSN